MDVDEDESTQQVKRVSDYGIEVDFSDLDEEELEVCCLVSRPWQYICSSSYMQGGADAIAELDSKITKLNGDIERMAPNMKAVDK